MSKPHATRSQYKLSYRWHHTALRQSGTEHPNNSVWLLGRLRTRFFHPPNKITIHTCYPLHPFCVLSIHNSVEEKYPMTQRLDPTPPHLQSEEFWLRPTQRFFRSTFYNIRLHMLRHAMHVGLLVLLLENIHRHLLSNRQSLQSCCGRLWFSYRGHVSGRMFLGRIAVSFLRSQVHRTTCRGIIITAALSRHFSFSVSWVSYRLLYFFLWETQDAMRLSLLLSCRQ